MGDAALEQDAFELCRARGPLRVALCRAANALRVRHDLEQLGFVRLRDYASERLGISARELQDLRRVGRAMVAAPALEQALRTAALPWSKVRALARLAPSECVSEPARLEHWIALAPGLTTAELERRVREALARPADEPSRPPSRRRPTHMALSGLTYAWWARTCQLARRRSGRELSSAEVIELVTAEVASALGVPVVVEPTPIEVTPADWAPGDTDTSPDGAAGSDRTDSFALDRTLRELMASEQRIDARLARLLTRLRALERHRSRGYPSFASYVREVFGIGDSRMRTLLRIDGACRASAALDRAWGSGRITSLQADTILPLIVGDSGGDWHAAWISRCRAVTVRRLAADVEAARLLRETDPERFRRTGGLPSPDDATLEREVTAHLCAPPKQDVCVPFAFYAEPDLRSLFLATLEGMMKQLEQLSGEAVSRDLAFRAMLAHACVAWGETAPVPREYAIYARDGWRCQVPGCSGRTNLHAHHVWFASLGGPTEPWNLVTLCAAHHLHGVHAKGTVSIEGRAPGRLRFTLGRQRYLSGDRLIFDN